MTSLTGPVEGLADRCGLTVVDEPDGPLTGSRYRASATAEGAGGLVAGTGSGASRDDARTRAVMECLERWSLVAGPAEQPVRSLARDLPGDPVVDRLAYYTPRQYRWPRFPCAPYDPSRAYDWVTARPLGRRVGDRAAYVPVEHLRLRPTGPGGDDGRDVAVIDRPLVRETSSGTAAGADAERAVEAAARELVERDALLRWWYRQTTAVTLLPSRLPDDVRDDEESLARLGFVVVLAALDTLPGMTCVLASAERGRDFHLGAGCATDVAAAARHAVRELGQSVAAWDGYREREVLIASEVRTSADHHRLYLVEPYAAVRRAVMAATLVPAGTGGTALPAIADASALGVLANAGLEVFAAELAVHPAAAGAAHVVRLVAPGLVPFHVGFGTERLAHGRLSAAGAADRLRTMLPHPFW